MTVSFCKYESNKYCMLLKKECIPYQKGCTIRKNKGIKFTDYNDLKKKNKKT